MGLLMIDLFIGIFLFFSTRLLILSQCIASSLVIPLASAYARIIISE